MERPGLDHETWHLFDIFSSLQMRGWCGEYRCIVKRREQHMFTLVGRLTGDEAVSMEREEQPPEGTVKELTLKRARAIIDLRTFEPGETIERSLYVPPECETEEISDRELRRTLLRVLHTIRREHPQSYRNAGVDQDGLCLELGISEKTYFYNIDYLCEKKLVEKFTKDPRTSSRIFITHEGIDAYERGLLVGPVVEELVAETREFVDSKLQRLCPTAAGKLAQTYADIVEGDTELRLSQVAYACRQILEDFTDAICDPEFLGIEIELPPKSKTKNKIQAALRARIPKVGKTERELMEALAAYVDNYFDRLNEYIQKCVHPGRRAQVKAESAKRCLIYTYLLIADVISLLS